MKGQEKEEEITLNIGALSVATGVPVETIRTWERRYGFPESSRNDAGHRIYEIDAIEHLRLITAILAQGHRPSQLQGRSVAELEELLSRSTDGDDDSQAVDAEPSGKEAEDNRWLQPYMAAIRELRREELECRLRVDFNLMDSLEFLERRLGPLLVAIGEEWASGDLGVYHEHHAGECIRDFLVGAWRPVNNVATGSPVVLATLAGEEHCLGLHMAALVTAVAGRRVVFLGSNTPEDEIAQAVVQLGAENVAISISQSADPSQVRAGLRRLCQLIAPEVEILVGGGGAPADLEETRFIPSLTDLYDVLKTTS